MGERVAKQLSLYNSEKPAFRVRQNSAVALGGVEQLSLVGVTASGGEADTAARRVKITPGRIRSQTKIENVTPTGSDAYKTVDLNTSVNPETRMDTLEMQLTKALGKGIKPVGTGPSPATEVPQSRAIPKKAVIKVNRSMISSLI